MLFFDVDEMIGVVVLEDQMEEVGFLLLDLRGSHIVFGLL
jgi:hypothetical protein